MSHYPFQSSYAPVGGRSPNMDHFPSELDADRFPQTPAGLALATASPTGPKIFAAPNQLSPTLPRDVVPEQTDVGNDHLSPASPPPPTSPSYPPASAGLSQRSSYNRNLTPSPIHNPSFSPADDGPLSLASHYLPGKIGRMHRLGSRRHRGSSPYVDQQRRSHYETLPEGDESQLDMPSTPGTPGTPGTPSTPRHSLFGAGAFRRGDPSRWSTLSATLAARKATPRPTLQQLAAEEHDYDNDSPELPPLGGHRSPTPSILHHPRLSTLNALPKQGGGRDAWGPDGGGHATLGAGGFEDDDGVNLPFGSGSGVVSRRQPNDSELRRRPVFSVTAKEVLDTYKDDPDAKERPNYVQRVFGGLLNRGSDGKHKHRLRWNKFKWALMAANTLLTIVAISALVGTILTWTNVWDRSDVVRVVNRTELILGTTAASLMLVTAILGWLGILLNNRAFLAVWTLLLWIDFAFMVAPGYIAYKKHTFNLEGKMNETWSRSLGVDNRRMVQNTLTCCGWFNPTIEASESSLCYARSPLPGCKGRMTRFERKALRYIYTCAFSLVGPHLVLIVVALLASNHVTYRFGKGITPPAYRLNPSTVAQIQEDFLRKLTDMYGPDIVPSVLATQKRLQQDRQSLLDDNRSDVQLLGTGAPSMTDSRSTHNLTSGHALAHSTSEAYLAPPSSQSHNSMSMTPLDDREGDPAAYAQAVHGVDTYQSFDYPAYSPPGLGQQGMYANTAASREHLMGSHS